VQTQALKELSEKNGILDKLESPQEIVDFTSASLRAVAQSNNIPTTLYGITTMLSTPDSIVGMRNGKLTVKIRPENVRISAEQDGFIQITIH
jgi:hypothetical protein